MIIINNKNNEKLELRLMHPQYVFKNVIDDITERNQFNHLERAIHRMHYKPQILTNEEEFIRKTDYFQLPKNILVIKSKNDGTLIFQTFDGKVAETIVGFNAEKLQAFFNKTGDILIMDDIGRIYNFSNIDGLKDYVDYLEHVKNEMEARLDTYHSLMDKYHEIESYATVHPGERPLDIYKEFCSMTYDFVFTPLARLSHEIYNDNEKSELKFFAKPTQDEKLAMIFGLYLYCLKKYNEFPSLIGDSGSFDEVTYIGFLKEFNSFLLENPTALDTYIKYFSIKKCERRVLENLLNEEALNDDEWSFNLAKNILDE